MSYKAEIRAVGESSYNSNGLRFSTAQEAKDYADELLSRWYGAESYRVVESTDLVNYTFNYDLGKARPIEI